jgi:hypothetical protein
LSSNETCRSSSNSPARTPTSTDIDPERKIHLFGAPLPSMKKFKVVDCMLVAMILYAVSDVLQVNEQLEELLIKKNLPAESLKEIEYVKKRAGV